MKKLIYLLPFLLFACSHEPVETEPEIIVDPYEDCIPTIPAMTEAMADPETGLIEGDIIPDIQTKGVGILDKTWPKGEVHYYVQGHRSSPLGTFLGFEQEWELDSIRYALADLSMQAEGYVTFIEHPNKYEMLKVSPNGIMVSRGFAGGSSSLGMQGGIQRVTLPSSVNWSTTQHEFGHALGLLHEHKRHDRDDHLIVVWDNIPESFHRQYAIDSTSVDCGPFDIESIMMYGSFQIQTDESKPELLTSDGEVFERSLVLSEGDIATIKAIYTNEYKKIPK